MIGWFSSRNPGFPFPLWRLCHNPFLRLPRSLWSLAITNFIWLFSHCEERKRRSNLDFIHYDAVSALSSLTPPFSREGRGSFRLDTIYIIQIRTSFSLAHPQFLHAALSQQRWRGRTKARGRAFTHAESGGQSPGQGSMARVPQWNGGEFEISRQRRKKPAC